MDRDITYTLNDGSLIQDSIEKIGGEGILINFVQAHEAFIVSKTESGLMG